VVFNLKVDSNGGQYRAVPIGNIELNAFTDFERFVLEDNEERPSKIEVADGAIRLWGRLSRHDFSDDVGGVERRPALSTLVQVRFNRLNLDQIVQAANPGSDPMPGRLAGQLTLMGSTQPRATSPRQQSQEVVPDAAENVARVRLPEVVADPSGIEPLAEQPAAPDDATATTDPATRPTTETAPTAIAPTAGPGETPALEKILRRMRATGKVELTESDLANLDVVAFLYNMMNLGQNPDVPTGKGEVTFSMEQGALAITGMRYFNRGTEIRALATVREVWNMPDSPLSGSAVGTARPLKDVKIPFIEYLDIDQIMAVLQEDLTTVGIGGTVKDPKIEPLPGLTGDLSKLLRGDVSREVQGSAGR
jgi:hypothetical protein